MTRFFQKKFKNPIFGPFLSIFFFKKAGSTIKKSKKNIWTYCISRKLLINRQTNRQTDRQTENTYFIGYLFVLNTDQVKTL